MAENEVVLSKNNNLPCLFFIDEVETVEETYIVRSILERELEINVFKQYKYISPIIKAYESQENELNKKLPEIAIKAALDLSTDSNLINEATEKFTEKLEKIIIKYGFINNEFIIEMNNWLEQRERVIKHLQSTTQKLHLINQTSSALALISAAIEISSGIGTLLSKCFSVDLKPKYSFLLSWIIGGISVTGSFVALSYSKQIAEDISRELQEEKYLLLDVLTVDRKGNAIDEAVEDLFPHGIDFDLVKNIVLDEDINIMDDTSWKQYISFAILLPNFQKEGKLIRDRTFLASVKRFIDSPAAKIWLYRILLHKLLDDVVATLEKYLDKNIFAENEVINQIAVNLYPIFFPLFVDSRNMERLRFICSSLAAISAAINLNQSSGDGFQAIRRKSEVLLRDYKKMKRFSEEFTNEYD